MEKFMGAPKLKKKADTTKEGIIHIRTASSDKSLIEKAADTLGLTVSAFILQNALKAARKELSEIEKTVLSKTDADLFFTKLINPSKANSALKSAFIDYNKRVRK